MAYDFAKLKNKLSETDNWLKKEFLGIRTGRASVAALDNIKVDAYGATMSVRELGNISVEDSRTIRVLAYDPAQTKAIEKAIGLAGLGFGVAIDDKGLRVNFPELTGERRHELVKLCKEKLEEARIAVRTAREDVWRDIQEKEREGIVSEDEKFRSKEALQKLIDDLNGLLEAQFKKKSAEIEV